MYRYGCIKVCKMFLSKYMITIFIILRHCCSSLCLKCAASVRWMRSMYRMKYRTWAGHLAWILLLWQISRERWGLILRYSVSQKREHGYIHTSYIQAKKHFRTPFLLFKNILVKRKELNRLKCHRIPSPKDSLFTIYARKPL